MKSSNSISPNSITKHEQPQPQSKPSSTGDKKFSTKKVKKAQQTENKIGHNARSRINAQDYTKKISIRNDKILHQIIEDKIDISTETRRLMEKMNDVLKDILELPQDLINNAEPSKTARAAQPEQAQPEHLEGAKSNQMVSSDRIPPSPESSFSKSKEEINEVWTNLQDTSEKYYKHLINVMDQENEVIASLKIENSCFDNYMKIIKSEFKKDTPRLNKCLILIKRIAYELVTITPDDEPAKVINDKIAEKLYFVLFSSAIKIQQRGNNIKELIQLLINTLKSRSIQYILNSKIISKAQIIGLLDQISRYLYRDDITQSLRSSTALFLINSCQPLESRTCRTSGQKEPASTAHHTGHQPWEKEDGQLSEKEDSQLSEIRYRAIREQDETSEIEELCALTDLLQKSTEERYLFDLIRHITHHPLSAIRNHDEDVIICAEACHAKDLKKALKNLFNDDHETLETMSSNDPYVLWLQAMIKADYRNSPKDAEALLEKAANNTPRLWLELAYFHMEQNPDHDTALLMKANEALEKAKGHITDTDRASWKELNSLIATLLYQQAKPADCKPRATPCLSETAHSTEPEEGPEEEPEEEPEEITEPPPPFESPVIQVKTPITTNRYFKLSQVIKLANSILEKCKEQPADVTAQNLVGNFTETSLQPSKINTDFPENGFLPPNFEQLPADDTFTVVTAKRKRPSRVEAMKYSNRSFEVNQLLRIINRCRILNDVNREFELYDSFFFSRLDYQMIIGYERILHEFIWSVIISVDDPHRATAIGEEPKEALSIARKLTLTCIEHTTRREVGFPPAPHNSQIIELIVDWLEDTGNFDNDQDLQEFMRFNLRCLGGSTLGHIHRMIAGVVHQKDPANWDAQATFFFNAKRKIQPGYTGKIVENNADCHRRFRTCGSHLQPSEH